MTKRHPSPATMLVILVLLAALAPARPPSVALAAPAPASCAPDSGTATISGTVTGAGSTPLNGVLVEAYTTYGDRGGYAYTNASGIYQVTGLIGGSYLLVFKPSGGTYGPEWYSNQPGPLTATPVAVSAGGTTTGANAQLDDGARISGQVLGAGGVPLQSVQVVVYDSDGQYAANTYTDAAGNYTTSGLASGSYRIKFQGTSGYLDEYYNDKPSLDAATPLAVTAPAVLSGVNATLARGGGISGRVIEAVTNLPLGSMYVYASGENGSDYAYTDASGNYTLDGLPSGSYDVVAGPAFDDVNLVGTPRTVVVTAPNTTPNVNLSLAPGGSITGRVTAPGGTPLKDITIFVGNEDNSYQNYVTTNATGVYTATALPSGSYRVFFRPNSYIPETYNNRPNYWDGDPIAVTAPNTVSGIDAELAPGGAVRGKVTDASSGDPVEGVFVEVLDANGQRAETATTQADGTYETETTLPSGNYRVRFNADERFASCAYITSYYHDKPSEGAANLVHVAAPVVTDHIDAAMGRGSIIFGHVTDAATGKPITSGGVQVYAADGSIVMSGRLTFLGGYHTESGLPSGSYRVKFTDYDGGYVDEFYNDKSSLATANPVTLTAPSDLLGIDAALSKGGQIAGRVTAADTGAPFVDGYVVVYDTHSQEVGSGYIQEDGSYTVPDGLASGSYRVAVVPYTFGEGGEVAASASLTRPAASAGLTKPLAPLAVASAHSRAYITTFYRGTIAPSAAALVQVNAPGNTNGINIAVLHGALVPLARR
jgi:5-hydroxyisourate hydrolase-like protein (transthyretin family)